MPVGGFPGLHELSRRTVRAPINPMDRSTVVSIYPKDITERKVTIEPGVFHITPGRFDNPSILVVGSSSWWREIDPDQPLLEIPISSIQIADSIVRDYSNGLLGCNMGDTMPGLFYIQGEKSLLEIRKDYKAQLDEANTKQRRWYEALVKLGDILWSRSNGNPLAISEDMKLAAQELGLKEKPWLKDFTTMELEHCPACGQLRDSKFPVCQHCKTVVNKKQFKEMGLEVAS